MVAPSHRSGMTLTELLVAITLALVVGSLVWEFYSGFQRSLIFSTRLTENEQGAYRKIGMVVSQLRRSSAVLKSADGSCRFVADNGDTVTLTSRQDSLVRAVAGAPEKCWFVLDSCVITIPADSGWTMAEISGTYPGRFKESHRVSQNVTVFVDPGDDDQKWGF